MSEVALYPKNINDAQLVKNYKPLGIASIAAAGLCKTRQEKPNNCDEELMRRFGPEVTD